MYICFKLLPPTNEVCEGYVFKGVCLFTRREHVWQGACIAGGHVWWGPCMAEGHVWWQFHAWQGGRCAWQGDMHSRGRYVWQGACMSHTLCHVRPHMQSMCGQYVTYWNAFLLPVCFHKCLLAQLADMRVSRSLLPKWEITQLCKNAFMYLFIGSRLLYLGKLKTHQDVSLS